MSMFLLDFPQDRPYTGKAGAEDREIQGWNPSADSSAGMTGLPYPAAPSALCLQTCVKSRGLGQSPKLSGDFFLFILGGGGR
jgi:hypothetical protein